MNMGIEFWYFPNECPPEKVMEGDLFKFHCLFKNNDKGFIFVGYLMRTSTYPILFLWSCI